MRSVHAMARHWAAGLALGACAFGATAAEPGVGATQILIGQSLTLQGGSHAHGVEVLAGVQAQFDEANRRGGVNGRLIVLRTLDDDNQPAAAAANVHRLVADGVFLIFGSIEAGPSAAVMQASEQLKVPFFGPMTGSPAVRRPHRPLVFPVRAGHRDEFRALLRHAASIGLQRVAFVHADSELGRQHVADVRDTAIEAGVEFVAALPIGPELDEAQLDARVRTLAERRADLVINQGSVRAYERLIRKARSAGLSTAFFGVDSGSTQLAAALGPLARGMVFAQVTPSPWARKSAIAREYQEAFSRVNPGRALSYGSLEGYLTAKALVAALRLAGPTPSRAALLRALEKADLDLGGIKLRYRPGDHAGSSFVELALVTRDGSFLQ